MRAIFSTSLSAEFISWRGENLSATWSRATSGIHHIASPLSRRKAGRRIAASPSPARAFPTGSNRARRATLPRRGWSNTSCRLPRMCSTPLKRAEPSETQVCRAAVEAGPASQTHCPAQKRWLTRWVLLLHFRCSGSIPAPGAWPESHRTKPRLAKHISRPAIVPHSL